MPMRGEEVKARWSWSYGRTMNELVFSSPDGQRFEREGYAAEDAISLCKYLNARP